MKKAMVIRYNKKVDYKTIERDIEELRESLLSWIYFENITDYYCRYEDDMNQAVILVLFEVKDRFKHVKIHVNIPKKYDFNTYSYVISKCDTYKIVE